MSSLQRKEEDVFNAARQIADSESRRVYVEEACGDDLALRSRVFALLQVHDEEHSFLERLAEGPGSTIEKPIAEGPGTQIGPYKLIEKIGEGGFGVVFMAEQTQPIRRKVALKVLKPGMDSGQVVSRFEAERQALALMEHPNIAHVLDGGQTATGRPYFVMELVKGIPITKYCDEQKLSPRERLALFIPICEAVQHAHQKGIIHRDLKPSNVLIASYDGKPSPKVIDFGVAKAMGQQLTERTLVTSFGGIVGTLEYMSPEQAEFNALDIDTRADIYCLGVMLYELLTGTTPLTKQRLKEAAITEVLRLIREEEPPTPSTRLGDSKESLASISAQRKLEPARLTKAIRGELDWIVMKCLEKDRRRRYETANGLARDIQRYLNEEVVEAGPPSARYKLRKFARKHRKLLWVAGAFALLFALGSGMSIWQAVRATIAQQATAEERDKVVAEKERADEQTDLATAVNEFMQKDLIGQAGSKAQAERKFEQNPNLTVREALDRGAAAVGVKFADRPKLEAGIRHALGDAYREIGEAQKAVIQLERAAELRRRELGEDHIDTLATLNNLGGAYREAGRAKDAVAVFEQARDGRIRKLGPEHVETLATLNNLALAYRASGRLDDTIALLEKVHSARVKIHGFDNPRTLTTLDNIATAYLDKNNPTKALALLEQVRDARVQKLGPTHPDTLLTLSNLANAYLDAGRTTDGLDLLTRVHNDFSKNLGPDHPNTLISLQGLARAYFRAGDVPKTITLLEQVRDAQSKKPGPDHPDTLQTLHNIAVLYSQERQPDKSIPLFEQVLAGRRMKLGENHPQTLETVAELGVNYRDVGRFAEAIALLEQAFRHGRKDPRANWVGREMLKTYVRAGKSEQALGQASENVADARKSFPPESAGLATALAEVGLALLELKAWSQAEPILRESVTILENKTADDWRTFSVKSMLGEALLGLKKIAEAEPSLLQGYEGMKAREAKIPKFGKINMRKVNMTQALERLVQLYDAFSNEAEAAKWRAALEEEKARQK